MDYTRKRQKQSFLWSQTISLHIAVKTMMDIGGGISGFHKRGRMETYRKKSSVCMRVYTLLYFYFGILYNGVR